jgi:hypothetical protein
MQLGDAAFMALLLGGILGMVLHPKIRLLTGIAAFGVFAVNLWTDVGGPFSFRVFFGTAALIAGFLLWEVLRLGCGILLGGTRHDDPLLSRAEPRKERKSNSERLEERADEREPTDGLWYAWRDRSHDDTDENP